jgi:TonB family protein
VRFHRSLKAFILLVGTVPTHAQIVSALQDQLRQKYVGRLLMLRHWYRADQQTFASDGTYIGKPEEGEWVVYGLINVDSLKLSGQKLLIEGDRLEVVQSSPPTDQDVRHFRARVNPLQERIRIQITLPTDPLSEDQVSATLQQVFATPQQLVPHVPVQFRRQLQRLATDDWTQPPLAYGTAYVTSAGEEIKWVGRSDKQGSVTIEPPQLIYKENPSPTGTHGKVHISGVVDQHGIIKDLVITHPIDPMMDKAAIDAVSKWRFRPATSNGQPVAVYVSVEVESQGLLIF